MSQYVFDYHQYKKSINTQKPVSFTLTIIVIILLLGLAVFLKPAKKQINKLFFVEINSFLTYNKAQDLSIEISEKQGAGYIYFDGRYHVLASFYPSKEDANKVVENLKVDYPTSKVLTIEFSKFSNNNNLTKNQNSVIKNSIKNTESLINNLYELNIKYDKNELSRDEFNLNILNLKKDFEENYNKFIENFKSNSKYNKAKENYTEISTTLSDYVLEVENDLRPQKMKYYLVKIAIYHSYFVSCF